jgi:hypothetical protein
MSNASVLVSRQRLSAPAIGGLLQAAYGELQTS